MSGRIVIDSPGPHVRFRLRTDGKTVDFQDPRRFGRVGCLLPKLGPEPLEPEFTPDVLYRAIHCRKAPIKALLMDQALVAGIGNIYATEALFAAGIRPTRPGRSLSKAESQRLHAAIRKVLAQAVADGGSTLEDESFFNPEGKPGAFQRRINVYGRKTGRSCGHVLTATAKPIGGRTSLYCPSCQK